MTTINSMSWIISGYKPHASKALDAFSPHAAKHMAYAGIYEDISNLTTTIRQLEKQIRVCKNWIIEQKIYHNSLSNASRLPDELLVEIWKYLAHDTEVVSTQWVAVTHVCSRWRQVALSSPSLWTWPCIRRPEIAEQMIQRANQMKFTLVLDVRCMQNLLAGFAIDSSTSLARRIFLRIKDLVVRSFDTFGPTQQAPIRACQDFLRAILQVPTNLEHINIQFPSHFPLDLNIVGLIRGSPLLKHAILQGQTIFALNPRSPSPPIFLSSSMTILDISFETRTHAQLCSIQSVLDLIRQVPHLRKLTLRHVIAPWQQSDIVWYLGCCSHQPGSGMRVKQAIVLNLLKEVNLVASTATCAAFTSFLSFPSLSTIDLAGLWPEAILTPPYAKQLLICIGATTARLRSIDRLVLSEQVVASDISWKLQFEHLQEEYVAASLRLTFTPTDGLLENLTQACRLGKLVGLTYRLSSSNISIWRSFGSLDNLRYVIVDPSIHPTFIRALSLIRHSTDTIFDSGPGLKLETGNPQQPHASLYLFERAQIKVSISGGPSERRRILEELNRINRARQSWDHAYRSGLLSDLD